MSNTKESMKLYTEEQLKEAFNCGRLYLGREGDTNFYHLIDKLIPIELPSDDEIYNKCSDWVFRENPTKWSVNDDTAGDNMNSFAHGAKWMRDKIQGGNNEQH